MTSNSPLVSVIIPFYLQDQFLFDAVRSIEAQTYKNVEIIVVDDSSPGASAAELLEWRNLAGLRIVRHDHNRGLGAARNTGVRASSGDLILSLDADDLISPEYLEVTVETIQADQVAAVATAVQVFGDAETTWRPVLTLPEILMRGVPSTFLLRRSVFEELGGYDETLVRSPDKSFLISMLRSGHRIKVIDQPLYLYRQHREQFSSAEGAGREFIRCTFGAHQDLYRKHLVEVVSLGASMWWRASISVQRKKSELQEYQQLGRQYTHLANGKR